MTTALLDLPHRTAHALCIINGIRDLIAWRSGRDWSNEFVYGLGQGSGFAYLRFRAATPPRQVYWGIATPRQHEYLAHLLGAPYTVCENRTFEFAWNKASQTLRQGTPPILGPLDMFFLPYYSYLYHHRHIPFHYVLLVGYDDHHAQVLDTDRGGIQKIPVPELELAWNASVPGMGEKNRFVTLDLPERLTPTPALIRRSIADKCQTMLHPPISMLGIPGIKKLAREIVLWREELGEETAAACLLQMREYLNSPPDLTGDHLTATHDLYIAFLQQAGPLAAMDFTRPIGHLQELLGLIPYLARAVRRGSLAEASGLISQVAELEFTAYSDLEALVA
jgi:hypothetical protein